MASKLFVRDRKSARPRLRPGDRVHVVHPGYARQEIIEARYVRSVRDPYLGRLCHIEVQFEGTRRVLPFAMPRDWLVRLGGAR